ncbi:MAG: SHOCT domain-containing protein [Oscillospiraceae bacterium]|nr:SHOCT domain-containing protein [Oscillospiraceae bacterium]
MFIVFLFVAIIQGIIFGVATQTIIDNKGYYDNWFWWGFFFGLVALIVACAKPENTATTQSSSQHFYRPAAGSPVDASHDAQLLADGGWKCACGRIQANYVFSCSCGRNKSDVLNPPIRKAPPKEPAPASSSEDSRIAAAIIKYKELLDMGIITQEEFDAKKKQLLGI